MVAFLTFEEAALHVGCSPFTLQRAAKEGGLTTYAIDRGLTLRVDELEAWVDARMAGHGPECRLSTEPFARGRGKLVCDCIYCHCGDQHEPGGPVWSCQRCHRPRGAELQARLERWAQIRRERS